MKKIIMSAVLSVAMAHGVAMAATSGPVYAKGWWWYEEKVKDPETKKEKIIQYKISPAEKMKLDREKDTNRLLRLLVQTQMENKKLNKKILERLNYAFPNVTPIYTVNDKTGKKCKTNSSSDCFIMPVIAEGQQVPVLKNFLRNPSPKNSKEWLKWQAKYFNHLDKISVGLRFAYLKDGSDAYGTPTNYTYGDNMFFAKSEATKAAREAKTIAALKDKIAILVFLGQDRLFENLTDAYQKIYLYKSTFMKEMPVAFVFPSQKALDDADKRVKELAEKRHTETKYVWDHTKKSVRPDLFEKYNVKVTPSVVIFYKKDQKSKPMWQNVVTGSNSADKIRVGIMRFLKYNGIIDPKEFGGDKNWNVLEEPVDEKLVKLPSPKAPTDFEREEVKLKKIEKEDN